MREESLSSQSPNSTNKDENATPPSGPAPAGGGSGGSKPDIRSQPPNIAPGTRTHRSTIIAGGIAIFIGISTIVGWRLLQKAPQLPVNPTPTPTITPTPTPLRQLSLVSTESAFLSLANEVASLSAAIQNYIVEDPSLSPPVLDLPLGFSQ